MKSLFQTLYQKWSSFARWLWMRRLRNSPTPLTSAGRPPKVLCILREGQGVPDVFELILRQKGCPVILTCDGRQGLDLARLEHPDVIIVDELVSGMDGFKVYTALNADDELRQIPLVFIESGRVEREIWRPPSDDVLMLPAGPQEIFKAIEYVLGNKNAPNTARTLTHEVKR